MHIFSAVPGDPLVTRMDHHVKNVIIVTSQQRYPTIRSDPVRNTTEVVLPLVLL